MEGARVAFVAVGLLLLVIGLLSALLIDRGIGPPAIILTTGPDQALFGAHPDALLAADPQLKAFRYVTIRTLAGLIGAAGLLIAGLAWFGLRGPTATWSLAILTVVGVAVIPFYWGALAPYREAGVALTLGQIPPFMWVPALVMPVAAVFAWIDRLGS